jgi:predicted transcriptional regulator
MATKVTFTLDDETIERLRQTADRIRKSRSHVVREAIRDFAERVGKLSERERHAMLAAFDRLVPAIPKLPLSQVRAELNEIRDARKRGGRGTTSKRR